MTGILDGNLHQRSLHGQQRRSERREVGADVQAVLREPRGGAADSHKGSRRRRLAIDEGAAQLVRELVRAKAKVLVRRTQKGPRGGDRHGEGHLVEGAGARHGCSGEVVAAAEEAREVDGIAEVLYFAVIWDLGRLEMLSMHVLCAVWVPLPGARDGFGICTRSPRPRCVS